jgi:hypothetical protein
VLAREPALEGGRLIDGWSILDCPARRSRIVIGGQVGGSIGRTRQATASETRKACGVGMPRSTRLRGGPGCRGAPDLANSERSTSQAIYMQRIVDRRHRLQYEVRRILKAFVDGQWLADFDARLGEYREQLADGAA